jgi:hypothetical protein
MVIKQLQRAVTSVMCGKSEAVNMALVALLGRGSCLILTSLRFLQ